MHNYFELRKLAIRMSHAIKGFIRTITEVPPLTLTDCVDSRSVKNYQIYGNSVQDGEPSSSNPVSVMSVGEYDEETEKYKIPVTATSEDGESVTTNIYLNEPLRAIGEYRDYSNFENSKVVRKVAESQFLSKYIQSKSGMSNDVFFRCLVSASSPFGKAKVGKDVPVGFNSVGEVNTFGLPLITGKVVWHNNANTTTFFDIPVAILTADGYTNDLAGAKAWVDAQNAISPILITYILNTPTEETIDLPNLPTFKGKSVTYTIDTEVQPTEMSVTYYSNTKGE